MSQYEVHTGELMKVDKLDSQTPEEWCEEYCKQNEIESLDFYDTWEECFNSEFSEEFITHKNDIYRILRDTECSGNDIFYASEDSPKKINYVLSYHNGGCGFSEALTEALNNMK